MIDWFFYQLSWATAVFFVVCLIALIKPFWPFKKRWQGALAAIGFVVLGTWANSQPIERPKAFSQKAWIERVNICKQFGVGRECPQSDIDVQKAEKAKAMAALQPVANTENRPTASQPPPLDPAELDKATRKAFLKIQAELERAPRGCENALKVAQRAQGQYAGYNAALAAANACGQSSKDIGNLKFGHPISERAARDLNDDLGCFAFAFVGVKSAMETGAMVLDGNQRPSQINGFRNEFSDAWAGVRQCQFHYLSTAAKYGFTEEAVKMRWK